MSTKPLAIAASALLLAWTASPALASFGQQGAKLVGTGAVGEAAQGAVVALSADGNTAIVGGYSDNGSVGASWVFFRSTGAWSQQGPKLVANDAVGPAIQGGSVALSGDGNTAIVGGYNDNSGVGAAWMYSRGSGGGWLQNGPKLVGTGAVGAAFQGISVDVSADGNTAIVGGYNDNVGAGAVWVYANLSGTWVQQGAKLVGTGATGVARQGKSVALSADGNTAIVGGFIDNTSKGAAWVFTRTAGVWSQQGPKLVGTGGVGTTIQGYSVAISGDGNTAVVGGYGDDSSAGAMWVFTRTAGVWSQQGAKLVGAGAQNAAFQGFSVGLSADGNTAIAGGYDDDAAVGASWVFTRRAGVWSQRGTKLVGTGAVGTARQGYAVALSGDGKTAIAGGFQDNAVLGASWIFVEASPPITKVRDVPNDQGGKVSLTWNASLLDNVPANPINAYWIWRQVPIHAALQALKDGATLASDGTDPALANGRVLRRTVEAANVYYWEYVGSQVSHGFPAYSYTASTFSDSVPGSNPYTLFMVEAEKLSSGEYWSSDPDSGYSVDNLPPGPPAPHAAVYTTGMTHLYWEPNSDDDFAQYRLYRGVTAGFVPSAATLVASLASTSYDDPGTVGHYYKLSAVDAHGNESGFAVISPVTAVGVDAEPALAFALEGAHPNPTRGDRLSVTFALPSDAAARLELLDMSGRRLLTRDVGSLGAGRHTLKLSEGHRLAPGLYWVRLTQGASSRATRVVVVE